MTLTEGMIGLISGGLGALLATVRFVVKTRNETQIEVMRVESKREETGTHATERAYAMIENLLVKEREAYERTTNTLRLAIEELRRENEDLRAEVLTLTNEVRRLRVASEAPIS